MAGELQAGLGLLSGLLALPKTWEDERNRALLQNQMLAKLATPDPGSPDASAAAQTPVPQVAIPGHFPGTQVPYLGGLLRGIGSVGQGLNIALGGQPPQTFDPQLLGMMLMQGRFQQGLGEKQREFGQREEDVKARLAETEESRKFREQMAAQHEQDLQAQVGLRGEMAKSTEEYRKAELRIQDQRLDLERQRLQGTQATQNLPKTPFQANLFKGFAQLGVTPSSATPAQQAAIYAQAAGFNPKGAAANTMTQAAESGLRQIRSARQAIQSLRDKGVLTGERGKDYGRLQWAYYNADPDATEIMLLRSSVPMLARASGEQRVTVPEEQRYAPQITFNPLDTADMFDQRFQVLEQRMQGIASGQITPYPGLLAGEEVQPPGPEAPGPSGKARAPGATPPGQGPEDHTPAPSGAGGPGVPPAARTPPLDELLKQYGH